LYNALTPITAPATVKSKTPLLIGKVVVLVGLAYAVEVTNIVIAKKTATNK